MNSQFCLTTLSIFQKLFEFQFKVANRLHSLYVAIFVYVDNAINGSVNSNQKLAFK